MSSVSIVIPCYNGAKYLAEAIDSALTQTHPPSELIVVDDGSIDHSHEVCARYPAVKYLYQKNQGVAAARNTGFHASQGEYLLFLDQDDRLLPDAIAIGIHALEAHPDCGFVFGNYHSINEAGERQPLPPPPIIKTATYATSLACQHLIPPAGMLFRRSALTAIGGFDPTTVPADDYDIWLRMARQFPIHCHNQILFEYRRHDTNQSSKAAQMLVAELKTLDRQWQDIQRSGNPIDIAAYKAGRTFWLNLFGPVLPYQMIAALKSRQWSLALHVLMTTLRYSPQSLGQFSIDIVRKLIRRA